MAKTFLKNTVALVVSIVVAIVLLAGIEWLGAILYPFPADFSGTRDEVMEHVANYPSLILALLGGLGWAITMVVAVWLATRLSSNRHQAYGTGVGILLLVAAVFNMAMLPYPIWYWIMNLVLLPAGIFSGIRLGMTNLAN